MQLTYRGTPYTPANPNIEMADTGLKATYRGTTYSRQRPASLRLHHRPNLTYRGVSYGHESQVATFPVPSGVLTPGF